MKRLTDIKYWDADWRRKPRPERLYLYRDIDYEAVRLLRRAGGTATARVLEMGAGGSRVLPYLARKAGFRVFGADFSFPGCQLLRANLALQGIEGGVVCEDIFQSSLPSNVFDLVFSSGLIEHFDDTPSVIREHLRVLKPGGRLVLMVPNLLGWQSAIYRRLALPLLERHCIFTPDDLAGWLRSLGVQNVAQGYLGSIYFQLGRGPNWPGTQSWPQWAQIAATAGVRLANGLLSLGFRLLPFRPHSRALSPSFYAMGVKPAI